MPIAADIPAQVGRAAAIRSAIRSLPFCGVSPVHWCVSGKRSVLSTRSYLKMGFGRRRCLIRRFPKVASAQKKETRGSSPASQCPATAEHQSPFSGYFVWTWIFPPEIVFFALWIGSASVSVPFQILISK